METSTYIEKQELMQGRVSVEDSVDLGSIELVAGADQAFPSRDRVISCVVVLAYPGMEVVEERYAVRDVGLPYIPGLLSYREGPSILDAFRKLDKKPDILLVDGHGIAHPRRLGLASYVGVELDYPTIGVAKRKLVGEYITPEKTGDCSRLVYDNEVVGYVYKSREGCNPLFISPGHKIGLESSLRVVEECIRDHKLPEPIRLADKLVNLYKRGHP